MIRHHHEKLDGSGYPDGQAGDQISNYVRILSVVDIYDSLVTPKPWREKISSKKALEVLEEETKNKWWDEDVFKALVQATEKLDQPITG